MINIIVELSKYLMIALMLVYTFECFAVFNYTDEYTQRSIFRKQNVLMFLLHMIAFLVMYLQKNETKMIGFYGMQVVLFLAVILLYTIIYPRVSRLVVNNMCMLMAIGFIMITRLSYSLAVKQFLIVSASVAISLVIPVIIRKVKALSEWKIFYAIAGVVMLGVVIIVGRVTGGAMLNVAIGGFTLQPSELVKIIFVFFVAASLKTDTSFKNIVITTAVAAMHVLILVVSKDLGAALIIFAVYLVMLYVASRQPLYVLVGLIAGSGASVVAYKLFNHVRVRVLVWKDPFTVYNEGGYQVAQSLMAIGTPASSGRAALSSADLASKASACSRATSPETFRKALMDGSAASITLRWASTSSREVTSPFLTAAACSAADSLTRVAVSLLIDYSSLPRIRGATNMPASVFGPPASASSCVSGVSATSGRR